MSATPFWDSDGSATFGDTYAINPWDTATLGGVKVPGIVRVQAAPARKCDKGDGTGTDGGRLRLQGRPPTDVAVTVKLWTPDQLAAWDQLLDTVWHPEAKREVVPYAITYPSLKRVGITAVVIVSVPTCQLNDDGTTLWTIKAVEYRPPAKKNTTTTPTGAKVSVVPQLQRAPAKEAPSDTVSPCAPSSSNPQTTYTPANSSQLPPPSSTDAGPQASFSS